MLKGYNLHFMVIFGIRWKWTTNLKHHEKESEAINLRRVGHCENSYIEKGVHDNLLGL